MFGFAWMFWLIPFLFFCMVARRWRRERWVDFTERLLAQRNLAAPGTV